MGRRVRIGNKSQSDMKFRNDTNKSHQNLEMNMINYIQNKGKNIL